MHLLLIHEQGQLGPKTIDEWATPNGDEPLLIWMLRELERNGQERVEIVTVEAVESGEGTGYYAELRP